MKNKNTLKILDKAIELAKLLIELQKSKQVPIPDYKKICKSVKIICDDSIDKNEYFVCDGKNTPLSNFLKEIIKKEKESDFHKGMLDAEKELQRVCTPKKHEINKFIITCPNCNNSSIKMHVKLSLKSVGCSNCFQKFEVKIINNKIILKEYN